MSSDASNLDVPNRSHKALPLSEMVKVLNLIRKEKRLYSEIATIYGKNESSVKLKKEKEICPSFAVIPQTVNFTATVHGKCLVKMEKALDLSVEEMNRKCVPNNDSVLCQKALSLYEDFKRDLLK